jgi:hypothetical protein
VPGSARIAPKDFVYHVLTRGNNKQDVFKDDEDFRKYVEILPTLTAKKIIFS